MLRGSSAESTLWTIVEQAAQSAKTGSFAAVTAQVRPVFADRGGGAAGAPQGRRAAGSSRCCQMDHKVGRRVGGSPTDGRRGAPSSRGGRRNLTGWSTGGR